MAELPPPPDAAPGVPAPSGPSAPPDDRDRADAPTGDGPASSSADGTGAGATEHSLGEVVAIARDIVLYAPIALVLDAPTLLPKLAEQGKQHMRNAKALGPHALRKIQNRLTATAGVVGEQAAELLRQFGAVPGAEPTGTAAGDGAHGDGRSDPGPARRKSPVADDGAAGASAARPAARHDGADASENGRGPAAPPSPAVDDLAIPDYDSLSALQVVDRLPGLTPDELEAVRAYEAAHRGRKTILNKAAQLQA